MDREGRYNHYVSKDNYTRLRVLAAERRVASYVLNIFDAARRATFVTELAKSASTLPESPKIKAVDISNIAFEHIEEERRFEVYDLLHALAPMLSPDALLISTIYEGGYDSSSAHQGLSWNYSTLRASSALEMDRDEGIRCVEGFLKTQSFLTKESYSKLQKFDDCSLFTSAP